MRAPSAEAGVLLACAAADSSPSGSARLEEYLAQVQSWDDVTHMAFLDRMTPLLYARVGAHAQGAAPSEVVERWRGVALDAGVAAMGTVRQLIVLTERLASAGVDCLHLKGPVLSQQLWGDPALRVSTDLDVLVRPHDVGAARAVALASGFQDEFVFGSNESERLAWMNAEQEIGLMHPRTGLLLELHWRLGPRFAPDSLLADELFERSVEVAMLGRRVRALGPADVVLVHVVHAATHEWGKIEDIAVMVAALGRLSAAEAGELAALAAAHRCRRRLNIGVLLAVALGGAGVPAPLLSAARCDRLAKDLAAQVGARLLCASAQERAALRSQARGVLWQARALDSHVATAKHLWRRLLTPGAKDWGGGATAGGAGVDGPAGTAGPATRGGALRLLWRRQRRLWGSPRG